MDIVWENPSENREKCVEMIKRASDSGARLILFPETTLTGFTMRPEKYAAFSDDVPFFLEKSREFGLAAGFGYIRWNPETGKGSNHFAVVDRGELVGDYEKLHPFSYGGESRHYEAGNRLVSVEIDAVKMGLFICYDLRFPEIFQKASEDCQVLALIANWPEKRIGHWKCLLQARAIENQAIVLGVNRTGEGGGLTYVPSSMGFDCEGRELSGQWITTKSGDSCLICEINEEEVLRSRREFPVKKDRRKQLYQKFYEV